MSTRLFVITGIAPFSFGERLVLTVLDSHRSTKVVGLDLASNRRLEAHKRYLGIKLDLNPLRCRLGLGFFGHNLMKRLGRALGKFGHGSIDYLIQSAGVYESGLFLEHDQKKREAVFGVNLLGHIEVLHTVMSWNADHGVNNSARLTYVEVGSFQGLYAREKRSLYASSKAAGIDLCTSLFEGNELRRCIYYAPGLIDTHMLHRNHWVQKSGGNPKFLDTIYKNSPTRYQAIFQQCDETALLDVAQKSKSGCKSIVACFKRYCDFRKKTYQSMPGVMSPHKCAAHLANILKDEQTYASGVYLVQSGRKSQLSLKRSSFSKLSRLSLMKHDVS